MENWFQWNCERIFRCIFYFCLNVSNLLFESSVKASDVPSNRLSMISNRLLFLGWPVSQYLATANCKHPNPGNHFLMDDLPSELVSRLMRLLILHFICPKPHRFLVSSIYSMFQLSPRLIDHDTTPQLHDSIRRCFLKTVKEMVIWISQNDSSNPFWTLNSFIKKKRCFVLAG